MINALFGLQRKIIWAKVSPFPRILFGFKDEKRKILEVPKTDDKPETEKLDAVQKPDKKDDFAIRELLSDNDDMLLSAATVRPTRRFKNEP